MRNNKTTETRRSLKLFIPVSDSEIGPGFTREQPGSYWQSDAAAAKITVVPRTWYGSYCEMLPNSFTLKSFWKSFIQKAAESYNFAVFVEELYTKRLFWVDNCISTRRAIVEFWWDSWGMHKQRERDFWGVHNRCDMMNWKTLQKKLWNPLRHTATHCGTHAYNSKTTHCTWVV